MIKKLFIALLLIAGVQIESNAQNLADIADNHFGVIDTKGNNSVIGPRVPFSSISPSPQSIKGGMDGYNPKYPIRGFGQLHVSGTGWGSYGHFLISPTTGTLDVKLDGHDSKQSNELAKPYYYSVDLDRYGIKAEIAPKHYSAIYRFTFPKGKKQNLIFDATQALASDIETQMHGHVKYASAEIDEKTQTVKMRIDYQGGWPQGVYTVYCVAKFSEKPSAWGVWSGEKTMKKIGKVVFDAKDENAKEGTHVGAFTTFSGKNKEVLMKVSISFCGFDKAEQLLAQEIPAWDFDKVKSDALQTWNEKFSTISIETDDADQKMIFYSSLFRFFTMLADRHLDNPSGATDQPYWDDNYAIWDTFRSAYPLLLITDEDVYRGNINFYVERFKKLGAIYDGFIAGRDRLGEQGGNDVDCIFSDAIVKNVKGIDPTAVYMIMKHNADVRRIGFAKKNNAQTEGYKEGMTKGEGYKMYKELGWMPDNPMSTSQSLEYSYNDYCAALAAQKLGYTHDAKRYAERSHKWTNLWNPELTDEKSGYKGFIDARKEDGTFSFIPTRKYGGSWITPFYEASTWTYSYYMPHDILKTIELMGGKEKFVERLNYAFENKLIKCSNEPAFLVSMLFTDAGRPDLTDKWKRHILNTLYDTTGTPENDDTGAMTSWYVFTTTGFFPNAGQDYYYLSAPSVKKAVYTLAGGKKLTITANASRQNIYVKSVKVNGQVWNEPIIKHDVIARGGTIEFELSDTPTGWCRNWTPSPSL